MLMLMNDWMMLVLMKCKCQMQCLTLGCYRGGGADDDGSSAHDLKVNRMNSTRLNLFFLQKLRGALGVWPQGSFGGAS